MFQVVLVSGCHAMVRRWNTWMVHRTGVRLARVTEKEVARKLINCAIVM